MASARILIVDDEPDVRALVALRVRAAGYVTQEARDGAEALRALDAAPPELVLLDVMMPAISGLEVLARIRASATLGKLPVLMLTAAGGGEQVISALRAGASDYILKPIDFALLLRRMEAHLIPVKQPGAAKVGRFQLLAKLGSGGMGTVFEAHDPATNQRVALKVLRRSLALDLEHVTRFLREAELVQKIRHPNVVRVLEAGTDDEGYFLSLELVEGGSVEQLLGTSGRQTVARALEIAADVAAGLEALQDAGILHRDVKPGNILLTPEGRAKLVDFGIARDTWADDRLTAGGLGVGSLCYSSPEQLEGRGDHRADIYALGCTLYELLTGQPPFPRELGERERLAQKERTPPNPRALLPSVPAKVAELVLRMMAPKERRRPASWVEVREVLASLSEELAPAREARGGTG